MSTLITALGGVGVFLLGMLVMTEGLKALAGARLSQWLAEATRSPWSGAATGAISTAILQSSSATTVAAVGFVGAELISFSQALGIIFGANIGTTITGWLVALVGFKLKLGVLLLPLIFAGVMMRFFGAARLAHAGYALAGFGLIFLGIDLLQQAAAAHTDLVNLDIFPADSWHGRLKLLLIGCVITIITQSSSAGVATALVAINAGAINFEQGAALVIGMDVGTTVTAAIATVGGSVATRRTGFSHVIYNCFTAIGALLLISPFVYIWEATVSSQILGNPEIALVAFHTTFNLLGALLVLPFTSQFATMMTTLIADSGPRYARALDTALLREPGVALLTAQKIIVTEFITLLVNINLILEQEQHEIRADMPRLRAILEETRDYLDRISISDPDSREAQQLVALIHATDHMLRLHERCDEDLGRAIIASERGELAEVESNLDDQIDEIIGAIEAHDLQRAQEMSDDTYRLIDDMENPQREIIYQRVVREEIDIRYATECAEALRWLTRVSHHVSKICYYLNQSQGK
jgi:phosphate:Na+ symporter